MPIDRTNFTALVDDDGSNTVGTNWNKSHIQSVLLDPIDELFGEPAGGAYSTTGSQNNINFDGGASVQTCGIVRLSNASLLTITGIANGAKGRFLWLYSVGAGQVDLANLSGSSSAANQIANQVTGTISLAPAKGRVLLYHDGTNWRVITHEQGAWLTRTFVAGNYVGSAGGWTVASGQVASEAYILRGSTLTVEINITGSTSTAPGNQYRVKIPGGFSANRLVDAGAQVVDNGTNVAGLLEVAPGADPTMLFFFRADLANYTAGAANVGVRGSISFEVT